MADNQGKQAVPIIGAERPLVCTGIESMLDVGVYKASEVLEGFYNEQVYLNKDLEKEKDEILHSDLILQSIDEGLSTRVLKLHVVFCDTHNCCYQDYVELSIPVFKQTVNNDMFSYRINPKVNNVYHCDDVIAYSSDYDIRQYDKELLVNYGGVDVDEHSFDGSMALGHNFLVGFKSYGGSSIDDGIVINKKLVSDDTLTSIFIKKETGKSNFQKIFVWVLGIDKMLGLVRDPKVANKNRMKKMLQDSTDVEIRYVLFTSTTEDLEEIVISAIRWVICDNVATRELNRIKANEDYPEQVGPVLGVLYSKGATPPCRKFKKMTLDGELLI